MPTESGQNTERGLEHDFEEGRHSEGVVCVQEGEPDVEPVESRAVVHDEQIPALFWHPGRVLLQAMSKHTELSAEKQL